MRLSLHIWRFEILLWLRSRKPVPSVVAVDPEQYQAVADVLNAF